MMSQFVWNIQIPSLSRTKGELDSPSNITNIS